MHLKKIHIIFLYNSSTYTEKEEKYAEQEEQEARSIQLRLAKQLDEADFSLDVFSTPGQKEEKETTNEIHLKTDLSGLSERQKDQLFKKDSPEFEGLVQDFQQRLEESEKILEPVLDYFKSKKLENLPIFEFVATKNKLILNYCTNVAFYLVLKSKRIPIKNHPLVKRLVQMRQLLIQLEDKYISVVKPQLELLLEELSDGKDVVIRIPGEEKKVEVKKKKLKMMKSMEVDGDDDEDDLDLDDIKLDESSDEEKKVEDDESDDNEDDKDMEEEIEGGEIEEAGEETAKRPITYQIAKNKGLKQFRKKELRNPRVKHKLKYKKALIRRKGAIRTVRKEVKRYGGEMSGIKATVKKGIKIK